jgi:glutaminyl-peptide cyclotransferase
VFGGCALIVVSSIAAWAQTAPKFDSNRAWEHLRQMVAIGPRPAGSPAIEQTRKYIKDQLAASGLKAAEQAWDDETPLGKVHMVNLIVTIPGTSKDRLAITGHYDTKLFREFRFVGASDGASSAAFLIELARVLKARRNRMTMELVFLDGEEAVIDWRGLDHTYGSRHYVDAARRDGSLASLKAMVLVDMIGDRDLGIRRETYSIPWLTDIIWSSAARLGHAQHFLADSMPVEDDHVPFLKLGVPATLLIDFDYPPWHTADDTLDKVSAASLAVVGSVLLDALPAIELYLSR